MNFLWMQGVYIVYWFTSLLIYCNASASRCHFGTDVGLSPGQIVLDGDPAPPPQKNGHSPHFRPMSSVAKRSPISATAEHLSDNLGHFSCMTASNLTKITETPQRRRTMFVVARIYAFSVSVWKCSVIDKLLSRRTDGRSKSKAKICGETFTRARQSVSRWPFVKWFALCYRTVVLSCLSCLSVSNVGLSQEVSATTRNKLRAFVFYFSSNASEEEMTVFLSKITPRNLTSSMTGIGLPLRESCRSGWSLCRRQKCKHTVFAVENLKPLVSAHSCNLLRHRCRCLSIMWMCLNGSK